MLRKRILSLILILSLISTLFVTVNAEKVWDPFNGDKDVNVVYLGGSITQGDGYRLYISDYLEKTYEGIVEGRKITSHNAGVGGTGSDYGIIRLNRDVMSKNPDLVFIEFAVNDGDSTDFSSTKKNQVLNDMEGIVRNLQTMENPPMIVFLYTTGTNFKNASSVHHEIAEYYEIPEIDFRQYMIDNDYEAAEKGVTYSQLPSKLKNIYSDLTHPNGNGAKLWGEYAVEVMKNNPEKYFIHPIIKPKAYSDGVMTDFIFDWISSKDAFEAGSLKMTGEKDVDYTVGNKSITMNSIKASLAFTYKGRFMAMQAKTGAAYSEASIVLGREALKVQTNSLYEQDIIKYSKFNTDAYFDHTITVTPSGILPEGVSSPKIEISGFFIEAKAIRSYPVKYPESANINKKKEEKKEEGLSETQQKYINMATTFGIFETSEAENPEREISRAEFANIIMSILRPNYDKNKEWIQQVFGDDYNDKMITSQGGIKSPFDDVETNHEYFNEVYECYKLGIMNGVSETAFDPERPIKTIEAASVLLKLLRYKPVTDFFGGYQAGVLKCATDDGILNGFSDYNAPVDIVGLAHMLYNVYDVNLYEVNMRTGDMVYDKSDETFLTFYLNMNWVSGLMSQTQSTSLDGKTKNDTVIIDGYVFKPGENMEYLNEFIGRDIKAYYIDEEDEETIVLAYLTDKDETVTIKAQDVAKFENNKLSFENGKSNKTLDIDKSAYLIYNGVAMKKYSDSLFCFEKGEITLIKSKNSNEYDIVIINDYTDWIVHNHDEKNQVIYRKPDGKIIKDEATESIKYEEMYVLVKNSSGEYVDISDIKADSVLSVARNGDIVNILIADSKPVDITVKGIAKESIRDIEYEVVTSEEIKYSILSDYTTRNDFPKFFVGDSYTLLLDVFGYVVSAEKTASNGVIKGMLMDAYPGTNDNGEDVVTVKITDFSAITKKYETADKIKITNNEGSDGVYKAPGEICKALCEVKNGSVTENIWNGFIEFKLDADGDIKEIKMAKTVIDENDDKDTFYDLLKVSNISVEKYTAKTPNYAFIASGAKTLYAEKGSTVFLKCNSTDENKNRATTTITDIFTNDKKYSIVAYGKNPETCLADFVISYGSTTATEKRYTYSSLYMVDKISTVLLEDEEVLMLNATRLKTDGKIESVMLYSEKGDFVAKDGSEYSYLERCPDLIETGTLYKPENGDIVRIVTDADDTNFIDEMYMVYKTNAEDLSSKENKNTGWIVGADALYDNTKTMGNPYAIQTTNPVTNAASFTDSQWRTVVNQGYITAYDSGVVGYTTQNLSENAFNKNLTQYLTSNFRRSDVALFVMEGGRKGKTITVANDSDIRTYESYRSGASKLILVYCYFAGVGILINE